MTAEFTNPLDSIKIASPCSAASVVITAVGSIGITAFVNQTDETATMGAIAIENTQIPQTIHQTETGEVPVQPNEEPEMIKGEIAMPEEE